VECSTHIPKAMGDWDEAVERSLCPSEQLLQKPGEEECPKQEPERDAGEPLHQLTVPRRLDDLGGVREPEVADGDRLRVRSLPRSRSRSRSRVRSASQAPIAPARTSASRRESVRRMVASAGTLRWPGAWWRAPSAARTGWGAAARTRQSRRSTARPRQHRAGR
jgi:hypothetical protein